MRGAQAGKVARSRQGQLSGVGGTVPAAAVIAAYFETAIGLAV